MSIQGTRYVGGTKYNGEHPSTATHTWHGIVVIFMFVFQHVRPSVSMHGSSGTGTSQWVSWACIGISFQVGTTALYLSP